MSKWDVDFVEVVEVKKGGIAVALKWCNKLYIANMALKFVSVNVLQIINLMGL